MRRFAFLLLLLLWKQDSVRSIRLLELRVPAHAAAGGEALLGCQFDMEDKVLYSVIWYKDSREFYHYKPRSKIPVRSFETRGVVVDMSRSSVDVVTLVNLTRESAGVYRCEVSGEGPFFETVSDEKYITIHVLPKTIPQVTGLRATYRVGDYVKANCTSPASRPEAQLKWLVNDMMVPGEDLQGSWYRETEDPPDTIETILQLGFTVMPTHYKNRIMELKCQATIAPMYQQEAVFRIVRPDSRTPAAPQTFDRGEDVKQMMINKFKELSRTTDLLQPTVPPPPPEDEKDHATVMEKSLTTIIIFTFLLQFVIL